MSVSIGEVLPPNPDSEGDAELQATIARLQAAVDYLLRTGDDPAAFDALVTDEELAAQVVSLQEWVTGQINVALTAQTNLFVVKAGDTMGGALFLSGDPTEPLHAVTKQYADSIQGAVTAGAVLKAGDTMGGALYLLGDPMDAQQAANKNYVDSQVASIIPQIPPPGLTESDVTALINAAILNLQGTPTGVVTNIDVSAGNVVISDGQWASTDTFNIIGATTSGRTVTLPATATGTRTFVSARTNTRTVSVRKGTASYSLPAGGFAIVYSDGSANNMRVIASGSGTSSFVSKAGDTMTGALALPGNPTTALQAAPKQYVDIIGNELRQFTAPVPDGNAKSLPVPLHFDIIIPAGTYSEAVRGTVNATGSTAYTVKKNGVTIGTGTISAAALRGNLVVGSDVTIQGAGVDDLDVAGPTTADATLVGVSVSVPYRRVR